MNRSITASAAVVWARLVPGDERPPSAMMPSKRVIICHPENAATEIQCSEVRMENSLRYTTVRGTPQRR